MRVLISLTAVTLAMAVAQPAEARRQNVNPLGDRTEDMPVPADLQVPLILKVLTYDRNFDARATSELRIGIVVGPGQDALKRRDQIAAIFHNYSAVRGVPIRYSVVDYVSDAQLASFAKSNRITVLYIAPGNGANLEGVLRICVDQRIVTATGVPEYVDRGVAVGVGVTQDKPLILINLPSSKSAGSEFDASLLRIAKVIR